ncbi:MAG: hypothetical protein SPJ34_05750, partial [Candidatus Ornithospirochaeta sp.]|nr:hypothetical protein [Candidatus Ornithospirochaeta sp.]
AFRHHAGNAIGRRKRLPDPYGRSLFCSLLGFYYKLLISLYPADMGGCLISLIGEIDDPYGRIQPESRR